MPRPLRSSPRPRRLSFESLEARLAPAANPIVEENLLPGNPQSEWGIVGNGDPTLQGFATNISVNQGETVSFKINDTTLAAYHIDIYRMGYYRGTAARKVATIPSSQTLAGSCQPAPLYNSATDLVDAGNWTVAASWAVPAAAASGVYIATLVREDTGGTAATSSSSSATTTASPTCCSRRRTPPGRRTTAGVAGACTAGRTASGAYKVSYNRPFSTRTDVRQRPRLLLRRRIPHGPLDGGQRVQRQLLHRRGHATGSAARSWSTSAFLSVGHDEYWSGPAARQRRGGPRRGGQPGLLQRQRGVLEDAVGEQHRRVRARPTARW